MKPQLGENLNELRLFWNNLALDQIVQTQNGAFNLVVSGIHVRLIVGALFFDQNDELFDVIVKIEPQNPPPTHLDLNPNRNPPPPTHLPNLNPSQNPPP